VAGGAAPAPAAPAPAAEARPEGDAATRFCMHCGKPVPRSAKFCPECGGKQE